METRRDTRTGPLAGFRVLDLTSVVLGPVATQVLADWGADVIKVEGLQGDLMRSNGVSRHRGMSSIFLAVNRGKRSLSIDLKSPAGLETLGRLLPTVDVLVHNMRVAAIERLGLGYEAVAALNPRIVYCVATGFGQGGPDAHRPAFDDVIQAACGLAELIGRERGVPEYAPTLLADKTAGLATANAVLAALVHRERSGEGQHVEVPMFETMVAFTLAEHLGGLTFDPPTADAGYARLLKGGRRPAPTRDGHVAMLPYTQNHWTAFFAGAGRDDLAAKYDFADRHQRNARVRELYADMAEVTRGMTSEECLALCDRLDIPATRIWSIDELPRHPHLAAVGLFERVEHPSEGPILAVRAPARFARTPSPPPGVAPRLGEHGAQVLAEAGFTDDEIAALAAQGVIREAPPPADPT
ncbi:MAG TPA: CoA transferase [Burkholderiaceae bacterium]|nr:CoA transferase [Burkholderiaceae bacterium]